MQKVIIVRLVKRILTSKAMWRVLVDMKKKDKFTMENLWRKSKYKKNY
jgi:hypothetical protein